MNFYIVIINDVPGCVINDQMTDADIQAAIEQELDCMQEELETVTVDHYSITGLIVYGEKHEYSTVEVTVHGVNTVTGQTTN